MPLSILTCVKSLQIESNHQKVSCSTSCPNFFFTGIGAIAQSTGTQEDSVQDSIATCPQALEQEIFVTLQKTLSWSCNRRARRRL